MQVVKPCLAYFKLKLASGSIGRIFLCQVHLDMNDSTLKRGTGNIALKIIGVMLCKIQCRRKHRKRKSIIDNEYPTEILIIVHEGSCLI